MPTYTYQNKRGKILLGHEIGKGGEAVVYEIQNASEVAKIYHPNKLPPADKLSIMAANPPDDPTLALNHVSIAWMTDLILDSKGKICGYVMPKITGGIPIHKLYNPKDRRTNFHNFTWQYLHRTARNLASAVAAVHAKGYVIGDLNESNILVQPTALVTLVDTDSFQVRHPNGQVFRCPVGKPDYIAPELQGKLLSLTDRTPEQDRFALAVLIFLLLMEGSHPFRGANPPEIGNRIRQGLFPNLTRFTLHPDVLHPEVWQNFERCFIQGHQNPHARPEAADWLGALDNAESELVVCPKNQHHSYSGTQKKCTWCERKNLLKNDPFPISPSGQPAISSQKPLPSIRKTSVQTKYAPTRFATPSSSIPKTLVMLPIRIIIHTFLLLKKLKGKARIFVLLMILFGIGYCNINQVIEREAEQRRYDQQVAAQKEREAQEAREQADKAEKDARRIAAQKEREAQEAKERADKAEREKLAEKEERKRIEAEAKESLRQAQETESRIQEEKPKKPFTNSLGMKFVYIPPDTFIMGYPPDEPSGYDSKKITQHKVTLTKGFYMQTTEVTQGQWKAVMGNNPSRFKNCGKDCPVEQIFWDDIQGFIEKLNRKGEGTYRLPTEAEWEYSARAGSMTAIANGSIKIATYLSCSYGIDHNLNKMGWYCANSGMKTHKVGQKSPNAWGLYDMHGNVGEWVQDWYGDYPSGSVTDPTGPSTGSTRRVIRGGSWQDYSAYCRSANREDHEPDRSSNNSVHLDNYGFRLVRNP